MLKIFTSYTPGAGKSYAMLEKAMAEQAKGKKVLIGFLNGGHRNIELIKEKNHIDSAIYNGKGFSYKQILEEKPDIVVLDEMGMRSKNHGYIYEIIELLLDNDIDVFTSINIKRFDSINPEFKKISGIGVKNMVPSKFLDMADEIYFIDRRPELMIRDFKNGNLFNKRYMKSGIMKKNFRRDILESYRKVSLEILKKYGDKVTVVERNETGRRDQIIKLCKAVIQWRITNKSNYHGRQ